MDEDVFDLRGVKSWEVLANTPLQLAPRLNRSVNEISKFRDLYQSQIPPVETRNLKESGERTLTTGITELDALLGGGLVRGAVYEVYGPATAGKSCLCCQVATEHAQTAVYITSENKRTTLVERMTDIASGAELPSRFLSVRTIAGLRMALASLKPKNDVDVVLIDSLGSLLLGANATNAVLDVEDLNLRRTAHELQAAIIVVNHVSTTTRPNNDSFDFHHRRQSFHVEGDCTPESELQTRPRTAMALADYVDTRLLIAKCPQNRRVAKVVFSKYGPPGAIELEMGQTGLRTPNENCIQK